MITRSTFFCRAMAIAVGWIVSFGGILSAGAVDRDIARVRAGVVAVSKKADIALGRAVALRSCTGCHVVTADQPFRPIYTGPPAPPDFKAVANRPRTTASSLQGFLEHLPAVPKHADMANPLMSVEETRNVAAFIMTLRSDLQAR